VLDLVGGDVPARSWGVLAPGGALVSTVVPDVAARAPAGCRGEFLMMRPDADALAALADAVARGALRSTIAEVVAPGALGAAVERTRTGHAPGKLVVDVGAGFAAAVVADAAAPAYPPIPPDDPRRALAVVRPEADDTLPHVGIGTGTYTILLSGRDTAGRYALIDMLVPPGGGPPPHRHDFEEMFTVLEGEVAVTFRGETIVVRRGETINVPANAPHAFHNASDAPARLLCLCAPAGQEDMFLEVGVPVATRTSAPRPPTRPRAPAVVAKALALAPKYRSEFLPPAEGIGRLRPDERCGSRGDRQRSRRPVTVARRSAHSRADARRTHRHALRRRRPPAPTRCRTRRRGPVGDSAASRPRRSGTGGMAPRAPRMCRCRTGMVGTP
jgi:quercetin dioxygenase-like cupin family protein